MGLAFALLKVSANETALAVLSNPATVFTEAIASPFTVFTEVIASPAIVLTSCAI